MGRRQGVRLDHLPSAVAVGEKKANNHTTCLALEMFAFPGEAYKNSLLWHAPGGGPGRAKRNHEAARSCQRAPRLSAQDTLQARTLAATPPGSGFGHDQVPGDLESRDEGAQLNLLARACSQPVPAAGGRGRLNACSSTSAPMQRAKNRQTHSISAILISSWMRTEGGKSTAGRRRWREFGCFFGAVSQEPAPQTSTSVHKQVDLGQDVLQGQALQRLQLGDF